MLKLKYLDSNKTYDVSFFVVTDNIVEIIGDFPIQTTGFTLSRSECDDNWDYSNYTTIYRKIDGGVQFSNDESIYEEPDISDIPENPDYIPEEPYKPTLQQIPWHTSDQTQHCKYYSNADMALIVFAAMQYVTYHVTYYRDLRIYIRSLDSDSVGNVYYGMPIPAEYQSEPLKDLLAAQML